MVLRFAAVTAVLLACAGEASAISGGTVVGADDMSGKAAVIVVNNGRYCSGLVYADSFIITAGHCLLDRDFKAAADPADVYVAYGRSLNAPDSRGKHAIGIAVHEHFLEQFAGQSGDGKPISASNALSQLEDIGIIRIEGVHPAGTVSARLPEIANEYSICCIPAARTWPLVWVDVYGFGAAPEGEPLRKMRVSSSAPDMVHRGKDSNLMYNPRLWLFELNDAANQESHAHQCHGDSGGPAFYVTSNRSRKTPSDPPKLIKGQPLAVGIISRGLTTERCGDAFVLVRLDYYRDWILSRIAEMRKAAGPSH